MPMRAERGSLQLVSSGVESPYVDTDSPASAGFLFLVPSMPRKARVVVVEEPMSTCKQCRWSDFGKEVIRCRRYPPTPVFDAADGFVDSYLPIVSADDFCGEFTPKLDS